MIVMICRFDVMKELDKHSRDTEKQAIESIVKKKKEVELRYEETIQPHSGHILFEINEKTGEIKEATYLENQNIGWNEAIKKMESGFNRELVRKKGCVYISALNEKSALKRWKESKGSAIREKGSEKLDFI